MCSQKTVSFWSPSSKWLLAGLLATAAGNVPAAEFNFESAGARYGLAGNHSSHDFNQVEAFADWNLPWGWDLGPKWRLQSRLEASVGWVGDGKDAAIGTLGPNLVLRREPFPLSLVGGVSPTMLSEHAFWSKDFGINFQFTSHLGLNCDLGHHTRLGYRFQHMSNAGLSARNPGLNLHVFAVSYVF